MKTEFKTVQKAVEYLEDHPDLEDDANITVAGETLSVGEFKRNWSK